MTQPPRFQPALPAEGPIWLPRFAASIVDLFRRVMPGPFRLCDYATADLPMASAFAQGLVYDSDDGAVKISNGSSWIRLSEYDADVAAIASLSATGILCRTGADSWALRSITGTANEIVVANGDGVLGAPTISLPAALTLTGKTVTGGTFNDAASMSAIGRVNGAGGLRATGHTFTHGGAMTGVGVEIGWSAATTSGYVLAYNRDASTYQKLVLDGDTIEIHDSAAVQASFTSAGITFTPAVTHAARSQHNAGLTVRSGNSLQLNDAGNTVGMSITNNGTVLAFNAGGAFGGNLSCTGTLGVTNRAEFASQINVRGANTPATGAGLELRYISGTGQMLAFDRDAGVPLPMQTFSSQLTHTIGGVSLFTLTGTGLALGGSAGTLSGCAVNPDGATLGGARLGRAMGNGLLEIYSAASVRQGYIGFLAGTHLQQAAEGSATGWDVRVPAAGDWRFLVAGAVEVTLDNAGLNLAAGNTVRVNGTQVVTSRRTGWAAATGTATRTTFDTATVTTAQLAERVKALIDDLTAHGLVGA